MPNLPVSGKQRGPRTLKRMALSVAVRNIAAVTDIGDMPFSSAVPLLAHIDSPYQLHQLEKNCPQLADEPLEMGGIWARLLTKKVPGWDTKGYLTDEELKTMTWIEMYDKAKAALDAETAAAADRLKQTLAGFSKAKEDNATQLVNSRALLRKMPGVMAKKRGPGRAADRGQAVLSFGSGSRTKMTSGQSVLRRARREAKEMSKVSQLSSRLADNQAVARSQIRMPPAAMMHDHRVAHQPGSGIIRPPKRFPAASSVKTHYETEGKLGAPGTGLGVGNATNEARLLALKRGGVAAASSASFYSAGPAAPVIHAPRKPRATAAATTTTSTMAKEKRPAYDHDDDDELFGVVTKPSKRARLTVEDLEGGSSGSGNNVRDSDDDLFGSDDEPMSTPKTSRTSVGGRDSRRERDWLHIADHRDDKRGDRSHGRSYDSPPKQTTTRPPSAPSTSTTYRPPPPTAPAGSPPRSQAVGSVPRKKAVDIFMRPKKR
ncbi:RNA polymerase 2 transcription factor siii subunit [Sporothrix brasiliensis 5110]|uniref:RNA polymerase 2 transcription factor siii subunit n=1 Tax=Sporothrix brasiliensis 5110 TaxID=1398154 RepID=A0A0C2EZ77_9PEZI|nr:RNA polymerase 2 transcription factor siii subunit [Sporothrix brasiliensis 5110]KIH91799.1 RNA polymerase 2 transcription factor siii subunit [Sporothrix brasiliensis 5110]